MDLMQLVIDNMISYSRVYVVGKVFSSDRDNSQKTKLITVAQLITPGTGSSILSLLLHRVIYLFIFSAIFVEGVKYTRDGKIIFNIKTTYILTVSVK